MARHPPESALSNSSDIVGFRGPISHNHISPSGNLEAQDHAHCLLENYKIEFSHGSPGQGLSVLSLIVLSKHRELLGTSDNLQLAQ